MVSVNCDNSVLIRNDRIYRYVGNASQKVDLPKEHIEDEDSPQDLQNNDVNQHFLSTESKSKGIPESILIQLKDIKDASDFIASFLTPSANSNTNVNRKDVFLEYLQRGTSGTSKKPSTDEISLTEDRRKLTKLPKISSPAGCTPEMRIIELQPSGVRNEIYYPSCVRLPRCSGCCPSQRLQCVPISKSFEDITVIRVKYSTSENRLKFEGFKVFRIEKHDNCSCDCIQKASDCRAAQTYLKSECRCVCPNLIEANECQLDVNKYWDYNDCQCKCKSVPLCSSGLIHSNITCKCETEGETTSRSSYATNETLWNHTRLARHKYIVDQRVDTEIKVQRTKGYDIFNKKGINPEIRDDYYEHT